jgi:hypothetical protein
VGFGNSTFGAEYKCTDLERCGVKMDGIAEDVMACLRPFIHTTLNSVELTYYGIRDVAQSR